MTFKPQVLSRGPEVKRESKVTQSKLMVLCVTRSTYLKYLSPISFGSKVITKVKVFQKCAKL